MDKINLENSSIQEINEILERNGFNEDCVYHKDSINDHFHSALDLLNNINQSESNIYRSTYFRKNAYGHFIGFDTEIEAKKYVLEIAKKLI